jgi:hypothetical protein
MAWLIVQQSPQTGIKGAFDVIQYQCGMVYQSGLVGRFMRFTLKALYIVSGNTVQKHMRTKGKPWIWVQKCGVLKKGAFTFYKYDLTNFQNFKVFETFEIRKHYYFWS